RPARELPHLQAVVAGRLERLQRHPEHGFVEGARAVHVAHVELEPVDAVDRGHRGSFAGRTGLSVDGRGGGPPSGRGAGAGRATCSHDEAGRRGSTSARGPRRGGGRGPRPAGETLRQSPAGSHSTSAAPSRIRYTAKPVKRWRLM